MVSPLLTHSVYEFLAEVLEGIEYCIVLRITAVKFRVNTGDSDDTGCSEMRDG